MPTAPVPTAPVPTAPVPTAPVNDFRTFMMWLTPQLRVGKVTQAGLQGVVTEMGLPNLPALSNRPDLIAKAMERIEALQG